MLVAETTPTPPEPSIIALGLIRIPVALSLLTVNVKTFVFTSPAAPIVSSPADTIGFNEPIVLLGNNRI